MAEDVLNVNMDGPAFSDYDGLSQNIASALKERDELIYRQLIVIGELEKKLSQYCSLEEFYSGLTEKMYHMVEGGESKKLFSQLASNKSLPSSFTDGNNDPTKDINSYRSIKDISVGLHDLVIQGQKSADGREGKFDEAELHNYENVELKICEEEEEGNPGGMAQQDFSDDSSGCDVGAVGAPGEDVLVDETSTNFENLLEEYSSSDTFGVEADDSFNSSSSSSSEDEEEYFEGTAISSTAMTNNNGSSNCNSRNSTLRKKQKAAKLVEGESRDPPGTNAIEEHLFGSLGAGGTLRRDHPSISKIFLPSVSSASLFSSLPLSASSPSIFSAPQASPGYVSNLSSVCCPCPECLGRPQVRQNAPPPLSHGIQQASYNLTDPMSMATGPIKPLAPLGLEPWRLKMRSAATGFRPITSLADQDQLGELTHHHQMVSRYPSLDSSQCNCKSQFQGNGNLLGGSNSSLEHQCHQNHIQEARRGQGSWRKSQERMSSGSESLSIASSSLSGCSCSCDSSQRCGRCSSVYQMLSGFQSPASPLNSGHFQFPATAYSPAQPLYQHQVQHNNSPHTPITPNSVHLNNHHQQQHHHHQLLHHPHHHHHQQQQQHPQHSHYHVNVQHQRRLEMRSDFCATSATVPQIQQGLTPVISQGPAIKAVSDRGRKRVYRIGLNIFNKKPSKGLEYLIENKFVEPQPNAVAKFLISRKGVSRKMIGQYMGNTQDRFSMEVLKCFAEELDLTGLQIDVALRVFQSQFEISGEAQRIERFMEAFATRYRECNPHLIGKLFRSSDTVFLLSYAVMMLNTDLHNVNIRPEKKMTLSEFIKNLKGSDDGCDINADYLTGIYERVKEQEFSPLSDHTSQVVMVDRMISGKKESLVETHRRFVCHFRMHEVADLTRNERLGSHSRGLFLFNDVLLVTKLSSKKKKNVNHHLKHLIPLLGVAVYLVETPHYRFGIRLKSSVGKVLVTLCSNSNEERMKFVEDLRESILETEKMEEYLARVKVRTPVMNYHKEAAETINRYSKDSGVVDVDPTSQPHQLLQQQQQQQQQQPPQQQQLCKCSDDRRSSRTSVDSGMSSTGSSNMNKETISSKQPNRSLGQKGAGAG